MIKFFRENIFLLIFISVVTAFFYQFFLKGLIPIPADTIVGLYHPFRDLYVQDYPQGIPFKNFLITDPVRQQYPLRELAISLIKKGELPLWNPYALAGTPLLANFQSAPFYPLNIFFFFLPFNLAWGTLIFFEPLLAGLFLYLYLQNLNLAKIASLFGALAFSFSGFFISWLEWGTVLHSALWLPLILLSIDKIIFRFQSAEISNFKFQISNLGWSAVFIFSLISSFFAGHLQTFFYVGILSMIYVLVRWWQHGKNPKVIPLFIIHYSLFIILTAVQWISTLQFINLSARGLDQVDWQKTGWFLPWQNLIQFLAPDFFGNPATLNYWGIWNYGEFIGYIGIIPLIFALLSMFSRFDKKTLFFGSVAFLSLSFALLTPWAKLPYQWQLPFLSTSQPTRILFLTNFSLAILAALGLDHFLRTVSMIQFIDTKKILKEMGGVAVVFLLIFGGLWIFVFRGHFWFNILPQNLEVSKRNLILPTGLFIASTILLLAPLLVAKSKRINIKIIQVILIGGLVGATIFDLLRFGKKFTPFTREEWLLPQTKTIEFLQSQGKPFRFMSTDRRIFPPNFSIIYRLETVDGYDPLYLRHYGELIAASERGKPDISPPFGFNRIITPQNYNSKIIDLLNVKYVLSLTDLNSPKLKKIFQEGQTRVYENLRVLPRAFFTQEVKIVRDKQEAIEAMFAKDFDPARVAVVEDFLGVLSKPPPRCPRCAVKIGYYSENRVIIETENEGEGFLVLTDSFYPTWKVKIDGLGTKIYRADYNFRGIIVPEGKHQIEFNTVLW